MELNLPYFYTLNYLKANPSIFIIQGNEFKGYQKNLGVSNLEDFLKFIPFHSHELDKKTKNKPLRGLSFLRPLGLVYLDEKYLTKDFLFSLLDYSYYDDLIIDLKTLNPNYKFKKNNKYTLKDASKYLHDACEPLSFNDIYKYFFNSEVLMDFSTFENTFHPCKDGSYFIKNLPNLGEILKLSSFTENNSMNYLFSSNHNYYFFHNNKEDYNLQLIENNNYSCFNFKKSKLNNLIDLITEKSDSLTLFPATYTNHNSNLKKIISPTGISLHQEEINVELSFKNLRTCFKNFYDVSAKSKDDLAEKINATKETPNYLFGSPLLKNLQYNLKNKNNLSPEIEEKYKNVLDILNNKESKDFFDLMLHSALSNSNHLTFKENTDFENFSERSLKNNLYALPNYLENIKKIKR